MILRTIIIFICSLTSLVQIEGQDLKKMAQDFHQFTNETDSIQKQFFDELRDIALNQELKSSERRKTFNLIGRLKTDESIEFLLDNIDLYLYKANYDGDADDYKVYPCFYSIIIERRISDYWRLVPNILKTLTEEKKNEQTISLLSLLLKEAFHSDANTLQSFLKHKLKIAHSEIYKKNLNQILFKIKT